MYSNGDGVEQNRALAEVLGDTAGVGSACNNLGLLLRAQGKLDEAEPLCREALDGCREKLGAKQGFFHKLVPVVVKHFGEVFPEIVKHEARVTEIIAEEEESFRKG